MSDESNHLTFEAEERSLASTAYLHTVHGARDACLSRPSRLPTAGLMAVCRTESFIGGAGRSSATVSVGRTVVENARHGGDQSFVIALAAGTAGELDGSRHRSFDHEGMRPSAGEHRERTTIRRREVGAGNGKRSRVGADRSSGRPPTESERIGDKGDKLMRGFHPAVKIKAQPIASRFHSPRPGFTPPTNRVPVSLPRPGFTPRFHSKLIASRFHSQDGTADDWEYQVDDE